jgi:hypothetical protein
MRKMVELIKSIINKPQSTATIIQDSALFWNLSELIVQDLSHWQGKGRWENVDSWEEIGRVHLAMFKQFLSITGRNTPVKSMLEWGTGGGANLVSFTKEIEMCYGVDISAPNLDECEKQLHLRSCTNFKRILISVESPCACLSLIESPIDFFLCTAVYQHFPSKEYGIEITKIAYEMLACNGIAIIQIRYEDGEIRYESQHKDYSKNVVVFTSYTIEEFWQIVKNIGFIPVSLYLEPKTNYAYYFLKKV